MKRKEIRKLKTEKYFLLGMCIFLIVSNLCILFLYQNDVRGWNNNPNLKVIPKITYENLTDKQINYIRPIIKDIKLSYLSKTSEIVFTNKIIDNNENVMGKNFHSKITVLYDEDKEELKKTICHEILHSHLQQNEQTHEVVYDLENYLPCFDY